MRKRTRLLTAAATFSAVATVAVAATGALAAAPGARFSRAALFQNHRGTAVCGIEIHAARHPATEVLCSARDIPRARHGTGDPFVQIAATGRPQLVLISQDSYQSSKLRTLSNGTLWRSLGVTCNIQSSTILCFNHGNHGFVIGTRSYKSF